MMPAPMAASSDPGAEPDPPKGTEPGAGGGAGPDAAPGSGAALVGVVMGSDSDWATMRRCSEVLGDFGVDHECRVVSAHRTPDLLVEYAGSAEDRGLQVIVAGAGGAAHLPGMLAAQTIVPVIGVPVASRALNGMDSLLSIVQMPAGVPVATMAIGQAGAANAGLLAVAVLARHDPELAARLTAYRAARAAQVRATELDAPETVR